MLCQKEGHQIIIFRSRKIQTSTHKQIFSRGFWKYIKRYKNNNVNHNYDVDKDDLLKHFANKSNVKQGQFNPSENTDVNNDNVSVEELDCEITVDEVKKTIRSLSRYKACDYENNVADFFIDACDFISHLYCQKSILTTYLCYVLCLTICLLIVCIQHRTWSQVPIYRKGDKSDPANY